MPGLVFMGVDVVDESLDADGWLGVVCVEIEVGEVFEEVGGEVFFFADEVGECWV